MANVLLAGRDVMLDCTTTCGTVQQHDNRRAGRAVTSSSTLDDVSPIMGVLIDGFVLLCRVNMHIQDSEAPREVILTSGAVHPQVMANVLTLYSNMITGERHGL